MGESGSGKVERDHLRHTAKSVLGNLVANRWRFGISPLGTDPLDAAPPTAHSGRNLTMEHFVPMSADIVESSLWDEDDSTIKIFMTMLAKKGPDHIIRKNTYQIAFWARKTEEEVKRALRILSEPDKRRMDQEFEGRRIRKVADGWLILNGAKYQKLMQDLFRKARRAQWMRDHRKKQGPSSREQLAEQARRNGDEATAAAIEDKAGVL